MLLEYLKSGRTTFNNTVRVVTNEPDYDYHVTNLKNYVNLSPSDPQPKSFGNLKVSGFSGVGMKGLPGDYTSTSRFVRAATTLHTMEQPAYNDERGVAGVFHALDALNIPKGKSSVVRFIYSLNTT